MKYILICKHYNNEYLCMGDLYFIVVNNFIHINILKYQKALYRLHFLSKYRRAPVVYTSIVSLNRITLYNITSTF